MLTDRLDKTCGDKEQLILNAEGLQRIASEPSSLDAEGVEERSGQLKDINTRHRLERRRQDSLLHLFPDEASHAGARLRDLAAMDKQVRTAEGRVEWLKQERRKLAHDISPYGDRALPPELRLLVDRNDNASRQAAAALADARAERSLVVGNYDEELAMLKKLWAVRPRS